MFSPHNSSDNHNNHTREFWRLLPIILNEEYLALKDPDNKENNLPELIFKGKLGNNYLACIMFMTARHEHDTSPGKYSHYYFLQRLNLICVVW